MASGASLVVDPRDSDALAALQAKSGGIAAAIDFVGAHATAEPGIASLRKAGTYVVVGLFGGDITLSIPLLVLRAINLRAAPMSGNLGELKELIDLVKQGRVRAMPVEAVPMAQANAALLDRLRAPAR